VEVLARIKMLLKMKGLDDERKRAEEQREAALAELQKSHDELKKINKVFVDQELRMRELKARIAELEKKT
jgi:predicted  nucleic acid-binding Zn-ribbon protein